MATPVTDFLLDLARNPDMVAGFHSSSDAAKAMMTAAGLTDEQQGVLLSGDTDLIANFVSDELPDHPFGLPVPVLCMVHFPNGDD